MQILPTLMNKSLFIRLGFTQGSSMGEIDIVNVVETSPGSSEDEMDPGREFF